ncbi:hypothetical protein AAFC00_002656 [Neodothiora populina]|uniref:Nuclear envelope protein n=1 Tax=Neodothiora populina TaxID=2781224 RepID=A0ABR3P7S0_9PEZI
MGATTPMSAARPYRDFLTPALHRSFTNAALVGLFLCWIEAALMAELSFFWSWFPLGMTGIRTLLLFVSPLSVFILRVAQLHFGKRTTTYSFETFWQYGLSRNALHTCFWYAVSAFLFGEVYIWSTAQTANLSLVDPGRSYERPRVNQRPVLLRSLFFILALFQSAVHLYRDYDLVPLDTNADVTGTKGTVRSCLRQLQQLTPKALQRSLTIVIVTTLTGPFLYLLNFLWIRTCSWKIAISLARLSFTLSKQPRPAGLTDVTTLLARFAWSALLLVVLWEISNHAFTIYTAQEPLRKGSPLTTDSRDPNGSLIAGLKAKKEIPKTVAFWELSTIVAKFPERRETLYADLDRAGGSTWSQISNICLSEIQSVSQRIQDCQRPMEAPVGNPAEQQNTKSLPRISQPIHNDNILNAPAPATSGMEVVQNGIGAVAKHYGSSAGASPINATTKLLGYNGNHVPIGVPKQLQPALQSAKKNAKVGDLRSLFGKLFRRPFGRQVNAVVFGVPYSNASRIANAIQSISNLVVFSLKEDRLGQVQKDIALVVRTLMKMIEDVQQLLQTLPPHWTDVGFDGTRQSPDISELLSITQTGLEKILLVFGEYSDELGLSKGEIRKAKQLIGRPREMEMKK